MEQESVEKTYIKLDQIEHVRKRPDTYIGSIEAVEQLMPILQDEIIVYKKIKYVPGLYKIFDEILVNASDNYQRDKKMNKIQVNITDKGIIIIRNNGKTIPVQKHKEHGIYVSQLIFGTLLTSSNYQDQKKKVTGGRNGFGAKLANIFSKSFIVETFDASKSKCLKIEWVKNMSEIKSLNLFTSTGKQDYTQVQFMPDFSLFNLPGGITADILALFKRRVYDIAGILPVKVYLNKKLIDLKSFKDYVRLYCPNEQTHLISDISADNDRWKVIVTPSDGQFQQASFVNGISTAKGGKHVNYVVDQIVQKLIPSLSKKAKGIPIKFFQVKSYIRIFINCLIENPTFDSQTKETLTTKEINFGSTYQVSKKMITDLQKSGINQKILATVKAKENTKIDRNLKKAKNFRLNIPKLQDANDAGTENRRGCVLILTEGDSAKALAMSGIEHLGRDKYGIFPLRGKPLNVKDLSTKQVMQNNELSNIIKILGLNFGKTYIGTQQLRYEAVMIMADQDNDGTHIKGLIINFFEYFWPSLVAIPGFLRQFITPIIRCKRGQQKIDFFNQINFKNWKKQIENINEWKIKYYKGLGTSTSIQARQYFCSLERHQITFNYSDQEDRKAIDLIFNKKNTDQRKKWLQQVDTNNPIDYSKKNVKIQEFINQQYIHFSLADNVRSIPSIIDGLKPSQRKVLYSCFKRNLKNEIKVAQLAGYVSQHSAYHHGETTLCNTIINMAQNFVGSNNINLLQPIGQFGTRYMRGKDSASPRYVFTCLSPLTRLLFPQADDHIVDYIEQQNQTIEPTYYYPILPLVLINGCEGIGTGWSTTIHPHKVDDVLNLMKNILDMRTMQDKGYKNINPGWEGFKGQVTIQARGKYSVKGRFQVQTVNDRQIVTITEIPINKSITDYKIFLQGMLKTIDNPNPDFDQLKEYHAGDNVRFVCTFTQGKQLNEQQLEKFLKITTTLQSTNMTLFDHNQKIKRYEDVSDIVNEFYIIRINAYQKRKKYLISRFQRQLQILEAKVNFIDRVVQGKFNMNGSKDQWVQQLIRNKYPKYSKLKLVESTKKVEYQETQTDSNKQYNYLLNMPIWSFCQQKVQELKRTRNQVHEIIKYYHNIKPTEMWKKDLLEFQQAWNSIAQGRDTKAAKDIRKSALDSIKSYQNIPINIDKSSSATEKRLRRGKRIDEGDNLVSEVDIKRSSNALKKAAKRFESKSLDMQQYLVTRANANKNKNNEQKELGMSIEQKNQQDHQQQEAQQSGKNGRKIIKVDLLTPENKQQYISSIEKSIAKQKPQSRIDPTPVIEEVDELQENNIPQRTSAIDSLLSKYLKPSDNNDNLSFQQRIKARLQRSQVKLNFILSEEKDKKPSQKIEEKYDFLFEEEGQNQQKANDEQGVNLD